MNFIDKKISPAKAAQLLVKKGVGVKESDAVAILDFLYLLAKNYHRTDEQIKNLDNPKGISNTKK